MPPAFGSGPACGYSQKLLGLVKRIWCLHLPLPSGFPGKDLRALQTPRSKCSLKVAGTCQPCCHLCFLCALIYGLNGVSSPLRSPGEHLPQALNPPGTPGRKHSRQKRVQSLPGACLSVVADDSVSGCPPCTLIMAGESSVF